MLYIGGRWYVVVSRAVAIAKAPAHSNNFLHVSFPLENRSASYPRW